MLMLVLMSSSMLKSTLFGIDFELIISFFSLLVAVYVFKAGPKYSLLKERYEKLISPLMNYIEPYLFKEYDTEYTKHILQIINENKYLARAKLIECVYYLESYNDQYSFNKFCRKLISEYDSLSFVLGLGMHSITYRLNRKQYKTKIMLILYIMFHCALLIMAMMAFVITVAIISRFMARIFLIV